MDRSVMKKKQNYPIEIKEKVMKSHKSSLQFDVEYYLDLNDWSIKKTGLLRNCQINNSENAHQP